jgi:anaerobic ribonucleoside-triphosphate reductase activating protein
MKILKTVKETMADGPGIRYAIYVAGCTHACPGCHNPESWSFKYGMPLAPQLLEEMKYEIESNPLLDGITISGGDPFDSAEGLLRLLQELSVLDKNIWVYTGYTLEQIQKNETMSKCLEYINTLVDGPYIEAERDTTTFKGSRNQRIIKLR